MDTKHTPGPWMAAASPSSIVGWPVIAREGRLVCSMATPPKDIERLGKQQVAYEAFLAECGANARLIAAAPDMLEALRSAEEWLSGWASAEPYLTTIRAAISKAEGAKS